MLFLLGGGRAGGETQIRRFRLVISGLPAACAVVGYARRAKVDHPILPGPPPAQKTDVRCVWGVLVLRYCSGSLAESHRLQ